MIAKGLKFLVVGLTMIGSLQTFGAKVEALPEELQSTLNEYRSSRGTILLVNKIVKNVVMDKQTNFVGKIQMAGGKFYWETTEPEKSLLVYDGRYLWNVQYPGEALKNAPLQVVRLNIKKKNSSPLLILDIFGKRPLQDLFTVTEQPNKEEKHLFYLLKEKKLDLGLKDLTLKIDPKERRVLGLSYRDDLDNETKIEFKQTQLNSKVNQKIFTYNPPKGAQVTEN